MAPRVAACYLAVLRFCAAAAPPPFLCNTIFSIFASLNLPELNYRHKTTDFFKTVLPSTGNEILLFAIFAVLYGIIATKIALGYRIIFDNRIPWDAYFSFDNRAIVMTGGGFERHPLSNYFFNVIRKIALFISNGKMDVEFRLVLAWFSVIAVSLSLVYIFKYLKNIIRLPLWLSWLIALFFSMFSTNILLSFTPETYTYTLLFLCIFNYYSALKLRKDEKISGAAMVMGVISVGGLTITNAAKIFIPVLFEKDIFKHPKKALDAALRGMVAVTAFVILYLNRLNFDYTRILNKTGEQYEKFSKPKVTPLWDMISSWFFGGNVLFSGFVTRDYHNKEGFQYKALFMDVYSSWVPYIFVASLLMLVIWSVIKNYKNKLVLVLAFSFVLDVTIHCLLKFGLHTSYIYGGHFVFVYPLLIGWLFCSFRSSKNIFFILLIMLSTMVVYLGLNNFFRMQEFFDFLNVYYQ